MSRLSILFVCTENICRSPLAEGILKTLLKERGWHKMVHVDSAGVLASMPGKKPDERAIRLAKEAGIRLRGIRSRRIISRDFHQFDYILAMDKGHMEELFEICPEGLQGKVRLLVEFTPELGVDEIPDPYYGSMAGFKRVFEMIYQANQRLLDHVEGRLGL